MKSSDAVTVSEATTDVVGARVLAQVVDTICMFVQVVAVVFVLGSLFEPTTERSLNRLVVLSFLSLPLYGGLLEGYWNGQTVGKRLAGIRVVDGFGNEPDLWQALIRNVPAVIYFSWVVVAVGLASMAASDLRQRVFDRVADTYVVSDRAPPREQSSSNLDESSDFEFYSDA